MTLVSANSNIACATYPSFEILEPQHLTTAPDNAFFRVTTNMPASMSLAGLPPGALHQITTVPQGDPRPTTFDILIWDLPEAPTATDYIVTLMGESIPAGLQATRTVAFTTPGTGRGGGVQESNGPVFDARRTSPNNHRDSGSFVVNPHTVGMTIRFDIFNEARATAAALSVSVAPQTSIEWRCPVVTNECLTDTLVEPIIEASPSALGNLDPGAASLGVLLRFRYRESYIYRDGGPARLHLVLSYQYMDGAGVGSGTFGKDFTVLLPNGDVSRR
jgi:hypothetical protein